MQKDTMHRISVAPMMDWTDRHDRYFLRLISRRAVLYTEMVTTGALLHGEAARFLRYDDTEHPVVLQLGGSEPEAMAECARMAEDWGYDEVNINVGCPSDRVQSGSFGACLMREPDLVARCVEAMSAAVSIPVTVKSRIGVDDQVPEDVLPGFIRQVSDAGCRHVIVHARKAWLQGLSPKENRDVPPLDYPLVHAMKQAWPDLTISINGGIQSLDEAERQLAHVDGVMIGRAAYQTPWILADVDRRFYGETSAPADPWEIAEAMVEYAGARMTEGVPLKSITRHMLGLFQGRAGARAWRRHLSENAHLDGARPEVIREAAALVLRREAA
ncbi:tRNA dihydrouridine(20/20a) synthase DusA [Nisaea acidiphila]|uniref:tRNA-dihydrouridine(20/20a) synthase n=1 Tax=Nisaea acidiphila TaxID=1862145 RepID=A0A9J7AUU3_9PROT|nr:tRNA dihydrouridine(20/20a) synthase DusA [Nisaea acidiphila]UUX51095.1 tRNA dihydrouridine(20/20a) synthase DusA [Nisaea acidiphila]